MKVFYTFLIFVLLCVHVCVAQQDSGPSPSTGDAASIHQIEGLVASYAKSVGSLDQNLARRRHRRHCQRRLFTTFISSC